MVKYKLDSLVNARLSKFGFYPKPFYTLTMQGMIKQEIKMIGDTIVMSNGVWTLKKLWTFKGWIFRVKRDPEKHTMRKLNAYWFNADCLNLIYKANKDAKILINQKDVLANLTITIEKALEVWTYLSFNGELQLFVPKDKFDKVY